MNPKWTDEELGIIEAKAELYTPKQIASILKRHGYFRTPIAIATKLWALGYSTSPFLDNYSSAEIARVLCVHSSNLRDKITALTGYKFRIVIGNQYRTGMDSIGWHADNEQSMGINPAIASVSLGSCRKFQIKPRNGKPTDFWLEHGSLLVMHPGCQSTHLHQVPKTNKVVSTRINLTFRPHTGGGK